MSNQPDQTPLGPEEARLANNQQIRDRIITNLAAPEKLKDPENIALLCAVLNDSDRTSLGSIKVRNDSQSNVTNSALLDTFAKIAGTVGPRILPSQKRNTVVVLDDTVIPENIVPGETSQQDSDNYETFAKKMGLPPMAKK